jgi:hypothetical protein
VNGLQLEVGIQALDAALAAEARLLEAAAALRDPILSKTPGIFAREAES